MEKSEYFELLKHPNWQRKRLEILQRDDFQCRLCSDKNTTLNVHHLKYLPERKPWEYENKDLITLCEDCHHLIEKCTLDIEKYKILKIKPKGYISLFFVIKSNTLQIIECDKKSNYLHQLKILDEQEIKLLLQFINKT